MITNTSIQIRIGILANDPSWKTLLDQMGVDWLIIDSKNDLLLSNYSVIVVNRITTDDEKIFIDKYILNGGAIIYTTDERFQVPNKATTFRHISSLAPSCSILYSFSDIFDIYSKTYLFHDGDLIYSEQKRNGFISYLGINVKDIFRDDKPIRKNFFAKRIRLPHEIVAKRSKSSLRQIIQSHLEYLHHQRNIPFVQKWFYPNDNSTLFTFRIDSDKGTQAQIDDIFQLSERYHIPTSWFLDVKSHESWLKYFTKFKTQEVGVHCYEHSVYSDKELNQDNFAKAVSLLRAAGLDPKGIVAPTGAWNKGINNAIQELGFSYSSEFSYDIDNLPSFPFSENNISGVVQLPIHPICIGTMLREHMSSAEMIQYYFGVIDQKIANREPICLYHHPTHATNEVFEDVFRYINEKQIVKLSYFEYSKWWKRRNKFIFSAKYQNTEIIFENNNSSSDTFIRVSLSDEKDTIIPASNAISIELTKWNSRSISINKVNDILRARKITLRHYIQNALDWWIKTTE